MKDGFLRVAAASPRLTPADPAANIRALIASAHEAEQMGATVLVTPRLSISGSELGDLLSMPTLLSACEAALAQYLCETASLSLLSFVGLPIRFGARTVAVSAAVLGGELLALFPLDDCIDETVPVTLAGQNSVPLGTYQLLTAREMPELTVGVNAFDGMPHPFGEEAALDGATLIVSPSAEPELVGARQRRLSRSLELTRRMRVALVYAGAGEGESGTDLVFSGHRMIASGGKLLAEAKPFSGDSLTVATLDLAEVLASREDSCQHRAPDEARCERIPFSIPLRETAFTAPPAKNPFLPEDEREIPERAREILRIQAHGLALRASRTGAKSLVRGVSGGLDSTLALLVACRAAELCGMRADAVHAVTMPCFGTTSRTKSNAEQLAEALGARLSVIDIRESVLSHFSDIGHDPAVTDVVYENAQARERTQILMDLANAEGGLVVGTGDLSELALGWATYNGDHMSMYGVNASVPKTLLRHIVATLADDFEAEGDGRTAQLLRDVLATPVSPELLPPKDGEIAQCTEGIVGPYELHDFFLYHLVHHGFTPHKVLRMAVAAFADEYSEETIRSWLRVFVRRFFSQQFKRSCLPDGPSVGSLSLSPRGGLAMPSDAAVSAWLADLDRALSIRKDGTHLD